MINSSLSTLGQVMKALANGNGRAPFRDSKLTRILQESLGGHSKASLLVTCSPHLDDRDETISALKFGAMGRGKQDGFCARSVSVPIYARGGGSRLSAQGSPKPSAAEQSGKASEEKKLREKEKRAAKKAELAELVKLGREAKEAGAAKAGAAAAGAATASAPRFLAA